MTRFYYCEFFPIGNVLVTSCIFFIWKFWNKKNVTELKITISLDMGQIWNMKYFTYNPISRLRGRIGAYPNGYKYVVQDRMEILVNQWNLDGLQIIKIGLLNWHSSNKILKNGKNQMNRKLTFISSLVEKVISVQLLWSVEHKQINLIFRAYSQDQNML